MSTITFHNIFAITSFFKKGWTERGILFAILLLILILVFYLVGRNRHVIRRRKELRKWAALNELSFAERIDDSALERYAGFTRLSEGHSKTVTNLIYGSWNRIDLVVFDYDYAKGEANYATWHCISAVVVDAKVALHPVVIQPSGLWDGWAVDYGFVGVDFPDDKEFVESFWVSSPEIEWAHEIVTPGMRDYLNRNPNFILEFSGNWIMAYRKERFSIEDLDTALKFLEGILDLLPNSLWEKT
ncbi:MAG: hypothetical protein E3J72_00710 [Planctomycetota bacterium]|nr:MAG: hypothetical protein E3J72_00710 [Planctomycetota bacterium]